MNSVRRKLGFVILLLCLGCSGPNFPLKDLKTVEDGVVRYEGSLAVPIAEKPDSKPGRTGKVLLISSEMGLQPRVPNEFSELPSEMRASSLQEVQTVVVVHYCPSQGMEQKQALYWMSFEWPSKRCLGIERLKEWPRTWGRSDVRADYPNFVEMITNMPKV